MLTSKKISMLDFGKNFEFQQIYAA